MLRLQIRFSLLFVIFFSLANAISAQSFQPDSTLSPAANNAIALYSSSLGEQLHLYSGTLYKNYPRPFKEGYPFFLINDWSIGNINYDGGNYKDVPILYDIIADEVIILGYNKVSRIRLVKEKVDGFAFAGHRFKNIRTDSTTSPGFAPGIYDVLSEGKATLLAKRTKNIQTTLTTEIELRVYSKDRFYLSHNNTTVSVTGKKALLEQLKDKKKELQQYIRQNKLRFNKEAETSMTRLVDYYNQLSK